MRTFAAQTTGVSTNDQIKYMANQRQVQNNLAKSGGGTTVPQFRTSTTTNSSIQKMASYQLSMDQNNKYNGCIGKAAGSCGGAKRKRRTRRKHQMKKKLSTKLIQLTKELSQLKEESRK